MRRRFSKNDLPEVARPSGALKDDEIEEIRQAYRDGCTGDIIIGLRGEERVITMLLPAQADAAPGESLLPRITAMLNAMGCNNYFLVHSYE